MVFPEEAGAGAAPHNAAKGAMRSASVIAEVGIPAIIGSACAPWTEARKRSDQHLGGVFADNSPPRPVPSRSAESRTRSDTVGHTLDAQSDPL